MNERGRPRKRRQSPSHSAPPSPSLARIMARRSLLSPALFAALSLLALYALFHSILSYPSAGPSAAAHRLPSSPVAVRIYLYDLPSKFTRGVIRSYHLARAADADRPYPGHQHSAEWWLFSDLLRPDRPSDSPVVRVADPADADLFFVPFFSSLSLVVNPIRPAAITDGGGDDPSALQYSDEEMQGELLEWLQGQGWWQRNGGWDHVFVCQDPNALYKVMDKIRNAILLVSDFGRLQGNQASLVKDVIMPYVHRINPYNGEGGVDHRPSLLFFMGNRYRKDGGKVRDTLFQILQNEKDVVIKHGTQSRESRRAATQGMHSSKFCLHPAGDTPSACRLFDAIVSLCVPVIVSDYIELPFEDVIDYKKIAIFVETGNAVEPRFLTSMLRRVNTERILQYQRELLMVRRYFEYEHRNGAVNEIWRQVSSKLPLINLMINRHKRLVRRGLENDCSCICSSSNETLITRW